MSAISGRSGFRRGRGRPVMAEINITPFTDVVLVILIIFMVSASFMGAQKALSVNLPSARAAEPVKQKQNLDVTITGEGKLYLNGEVWSLDDMSRELKARNARKPVDMVIVRADRQVPYEKVVRVMDAVKTAGIENIAFPTKVPGLTQ
jgi:biopolymer transport protein TolR